MSNTVFSYNKTLTQTDPQNHPVLIIGQLRHLSILNFQHVQCKLAPRVTEDIFQSAITCLHPSPTDFCPLYLDLATIAALPIKCSRHNTSSRAHAITRIVKTHTMNVTESILVSHRLFSVPIITIFQCGFNKHTHMTHNLWAELIMIISLYLLLVDCV